MVRRTVALLSLALVVSACGNALRKDTDADKVAPPKVGACHDLTADDLDDEPAPVRRHVVRALSMRQSL